MPRESDLGAVEKLRNRGIAKLGRVLDAVQCAELLTYFRKRNVQDPYRPELGTFRPCATRPPETHVAYHSAEDVLKAPALLKLANDPRILGIVSSFLGCRPTLGYLAAWWSFATHTRAEHAELFHRDVDDWKFIKLFVYLTDVDELSGPHMYVEQSSTSKALLEIRRFADDEVCTAFGSHRIIAITGKAGEAFLEDTFGLHKGKPVQTGERLVFQSVYAISRLPYGPRRPLLRKETMADADLDEWINRAYIA
jgi:hypothetical protein